MCVRGVVAPLPLGSPRSQSVSCGPRLTAPRRGSWSSWSRTSTGRCVVDADADADPVGLGFLWGASHSDVSEDGEGPSFPGSGTIAEGAPAGTRTRIQAPDCRSRRARSAQLRGSSITGTSPNDCVSLHLCSSCAVSKRSNAADGASSAAPALLHGRLPRRRVHLDLLTHGLSRASGIPNTRVLR
jgi:hypothetical protein